MRRPWEISRRSFLRGAGTAIGLPVLEAMMPSVASAQQMGAPPPRRMLAFYIPNGIHMAGWTPADEGANWTMTPILAPLAGVKDDLLVISGLANQPARPDGPGDHASGTGAFLTVRHPFKTEGRDIMNGISVDQVAANALGDHTAFRSLQLGSEGGSSVGGCDSGYSCAYARNISWASEAQPLPKETNPVSVFDRLFAGADPRDTVEARRKRKLYKSSILDFVKGDAQRLDGKLGTTDRRKLDEYVTGVRELEVRLNSNDGPACDPGDRPGNNRDIRARVRAMADLMVLAFQCDLTRVITYMLGNAGSNRVYDFLGIGDGHHQISHHQNNPTNLAQLQTINIWEIEQLAYLIERMRSVQEPDGTLLDNSLVFFSSEIEDGNAHRHSNLPVILAGRGGGLVTPGRHIRFAGNTTIANLFISMLAGASVNVTSFGADGTGPLAGL